VYVRNANIGKTKNKFIGEDILKPNGLNAINDNYQEDDATGIKAILFCIDDSG